MRDESDHRVADHGTCWQVILTDLQTRLADLSQRERPFKLVIDGDAGDADAAFGVVAALLAEIGGDLSATVGDRLSEQFTAETIEQLRKLTYDKQVAEAAGQVEALVRQTDRDCPRPGKPAQHPPRTAPRPVMSPTTLGRAAVSLACWACSAAATTAPCGGRRGVRTRGPAGGRPGRRRRRPRPGCQPGR